MQFSSIIGLDTSKKSLIKSIKTGKIAHAQLFHGAVGSAVLPMAFAYLTYLNCLSPTETDSCGTCASCSKINKLAHPDLSIVFPTAGGKKVSAAEFMPSFREFMTTNPCGTPQQWLAIINKKNGNIPVSESRKLIQDLSLKSYEGGYKMVLIWQAEKLNIAASNALLKIIEEPPEQTIFMFVSYTPDTLLTTLISRSQLFRVPSFSEEEIKSNLKSQFPEMEEIKAAEFAFQADGNLAIALEQVELDGATSNFDWFANWMRSCFKFDFLNLISLGDAFDAETLDQQVLKLEYSLKLLRELLMNYHGSSELLKIDEEKIDFISKFGQAINISNLPNINTLLSEAIYHIERNARGKVVFLDLSIKIGKLLKK